MRSTARRRSAKHRLRFEVVVVRDAQDVGAALVQRTDNVQLRAAVDEARALTASTRARETLLPILLLPVMVPIFAAGVALTAAVLDGRSLVPAWSGDSDEVDRRAAIPHN